MAQPIRRRRCLGASGTRHRKRSRFSDFPTFRFTPNDNDEVVVDMKPEQDNKKSNREVLSPSILRSLFRRQTYGRQVMIEYQAKTTTYSFRELGTPASAAVLGLNATGNALAAISSSNNHESSSSSFSLSIYSLPTPAVLHSTMQLEDEDAQPLADASARSLLQLASPAVARIPFRLWWSRDGRLVACLYSTTDGLATAVVDGTWRLRNVPVASVQWDVSHVADTATNLLWYVDHAPCLPSMSSPSYEEKTIVTTTTRVSSYLYCIDEGDGFRATWFSERGWDRDQLVQDPVVVPLWTKGKVVRADVMTRMVVHTSWKDAGWERCSKNSSSVSRTGFDIRVCAFISTSVLLHTILQLTPALVIPAFDASSPRLPNYSHHIVAMKHGGRVMEIYLVFSVGPVGKGCVGVCVDVDLLTQDCLIHPDDWRRLTQVDTPPVDCAATLGRRRRRRSMGATMHPTKRPLYPDCITIDNRAVRQQRPVFELMARDAPVRIQYR